MGAASGAVLGDAIDGVGALAGRPDRRGAVRAGRGADEHEQGRRRDEAAVASHRQRRPADGAVRLRCWACIYGPDEPLLTAIISGALLGLLGLRPLKAASGCSSAPPRRGFGALDAASGPAADRGGGGDRLPRVAATVYRGRPLVRVMAEEVPAAELRYVVPFESRSRYVGADYVEQLAKLRGGVFRRNPPDVGILASLDGLQGPSFEPARVHPLIREFYEHTSRFKLSIVPEWRRSMKPAYESLQALRRGAARAGDDPVEHRRGPARDGQHDRHDRSGRRRGDRHPRLDPDVRGLRQADLRRHLHELQARGPRLRERRLPDPGLELHGHARPRQRRRARLLADVAQRAAVPRALPELRGQRARRADRPQAAVFPGADPRHRRRRRAEDRAQLLPRRSALSDAPLRDRAPDREPHSAA